MIWLENEILYVPEQTISFFADTVPTSVIMKIKEINTLVFGNGITHNVWRRKQVKLVEK